MAAEVHPAPATLSGSPRIGKRAKLREQLKGVVFGITMIIAVPIVVVVVHRMWEQRQLLQGRGSWTELSKELREQLSGVRKCHLQSFDNATGECQYVLGDFNLTLAGVGRDDATFTAMGDLSKLYVGFSRGRLCPRVSLVENPLVLVFVSPANGNVYESWAECEADSEAALSRGAAPPAATRGR